MLINVLRACLRRKTREERGRGKGRRIVGNALISWPCRPAGGRRGKSAKGRTCDKEEEKKRKKGRRPPFVNRRGKGGKKGGVLEKKEGEKKGERLRPFPPSAGPEPRRKKGRQGEKKKKTR